jgi:NAD(P)-dependent dehydrogenase (short-subunit alcohol dehydrogenase family)
VNRVHGRTCFVTGRMLGIDRDGVQPRPDKGASAAMVGLRPAEGEAVAAALPCQGHSARYRQANRRRRTALASTFAEAERELGAA